MNLTRTVAPDMPVTLAEAKTQCRISHDAEDEYLGLLIGAAHHYCEHYCQRSFGEQTWLGHWWDFPKQLPFPPVVSVESVRYCSGDSLVEFTDYGFDVTPARIIPKSCFPVVDDRPDAVQIEWVAGQPASQNVRLASLIMVAHWYPLTFQQAIPPVFQEAARITEDGVKYAPRLQKELTSFANLWMKNIQQQQF